MSNNTKFHEERAEFVELLHRTPHMLPRRYVFVLTNRCNLSCDFCPQSRTRLARAMSASDWISLLDQLPEYAAITITGGEPLLFKGFAEVFSRIAERFNCNIITNGTLLTENIANSLLKHDRLKVLSISIDDIGNTCRGMKTAQWEELLENIRILKRVRANLNSQTIIDVKTVVLDENSASLADIHAFCMEVLGCDTHCFQFLKGSPYQHADTMVDVAALHDGSAGIGCYSAWDMICDQMETIRKYNLKNGTSCYCHPKIFDLNAKIPVNRGKVALFNQERLDNGAFKHCRAPWESVHINADGILFPCLSIGMGDIREQPLTSIIFSEKFDAFRAHLLNNRLYPACRRCGYLQFAEEVPS